MGVGVSPVASLLSSAAHPLTVHLPLLHASAHHLLLTGVLLLAQRSAAQPFPSRISGYLGHCWCGLYCVLSSPHVWLLPRPRVPAVRHTLSDGLSTHRRSASRSLQARCTLSCGSCWPLICLMGGSSSDCPRVGPGVRGPCSLLRPQMVGGRSPDWVRYSVYVYP